MKKLATWISSARQQLSALLKRGEQSQDALPSQTLSSETLNKKPFLNLPAPFDSFAKPVIILVSILAVYALLGFYALPAILKAKIPAIINQETGKKASIAAVEFNPFTFFASISDLKIQEKSGQNFVGFDSLNVTVNLFQSIKQLALAIDDISLNKPNVLMTRDAKGKFNFEDLSKGKKKEEKKDEASGLFPLRIAKIAIKEGKLRWEDKHFKNPVSEEIIPINLKLTDFSTKAKSQAKLDIDLAIKSGGKLAWQSKLGVNPVFSEGNLKLDKIQLSKAINLALSDTAPFEMKGEEFFNLDYKVEQDKKNLKVTVKKSKLDVKGFEFIDKSETKNFVSVPSSSLEHDGSLTLAGNSVDIAIKKAKFVSKEVQFYNQAADPIRLTLSDINHETDIKLTQNKDGLKISAEKSLLSVKNLQFRGVNQGSIQANIPVATMVIAHQFTKTDKSMDVNVSHGKFDFHDLHLAEPGKNTILVKIPAFALTEMAVDLKNREVNIDEVTSKDAEFNTWLNSDGSFNYQKLVATKQGEQVEVTRPDYATAKTVDLKQDAETVKAAAKTVQPEKDWLVTIKELVLTNYGLNFEDRTLKKPVPMTAKPINLKVSNISNTPAAKLAIQLDVGVNKTGSIKVKGDTVISPLTAKAEVDIKNIDLDKLQPYVQRFARIDLLDGEFNLDGKVNLQQPTNKPMDVKFKGDAGVANLLTRDQIINKDLVKWKNLTFKDLNIDLLANRYTASTLLIEKPYARVTIRKDKTVNFSDLIIAESKSASKKAKPAKSIKSTHAKAGLSADPALVYKLAKVKIINGSSDFSDLSLILPFAAQIKSLDGGADGISSDKKATIKVDLKGNAYDLAPVEVKGNINPNSGNYNIDLNFDGLPMPLVTPYMVQFAGYKIEKGKLTLGLHYQIEHMSKLEASNKILIDQLELGEKVDNPNAVSLPLGLAISLLKDSEGKIKLDVPLTGSLEDPKFNMGALIWDALVNVLTKIATAPFNALASLAGSDEDLSSVAFRAGANELDAKEKTKLDGVAKALKQKTDLNIEIKGAAYEKEDWPALQDDALFDQLKNRKAAELTKEEGKKVRAEYVELPEDDYNDMLADAFIEKFPTMAKKNMIGTPKLINSDSDDFYKVAKQKMQESIKPEPERLKHLANDRAKAIAKYVVEKGGIPNSRVYILDSAVDPKRDGKEIVSALSLKVN